MKPSSSRREFFQTVTGGFMGGALLSLLERDDTPLLEDF